MRAVILASVAAGAILMAAAPGSARAQERRHEVAAPQAWSFAGPLGRFDMAAVQRGYAVYAQVCSACHSLNGMTYGDLTSIGLTDEQVRQIAAGQSVPGGVDAQGAAVMRPATAADHFRQPFASVEAAAAANNGAPPPDQSRLALVYPGGPDRIYALLTGYRPAPPGFVPTNAGAFYNPYAANFEIGMPPPLRDGQVEYADGTTATTAQEARDVTTFLAWAAQPHLAERHRLGVQVTLYLLFLAILAFILKRKVWSDVH
ncbi:cytochrome c1 [Gluconacetobacter johannae]|uniref:Cytochrome c1 n=1 Tax=Gluconacetobacter johannae TaxID=112140 RepID=A0A7W4J4J3_9PROT|nr:cytochrome c1 [Gluconacetobacter johannae]MBB2174549.1 cytochrome c1 [Gluconacetobacter johannae]